MPLFKWKMKWVGPDYVLCEQCASIAEEIHKAYLKDDIDEFNMLGEMFSKRRCRTPECGELLPRKLRGQWPPPVIVPSSR